MTRFLLLILTAGTLAARMHVRVFVDTRSQLETLLARGVQDVTAASPKGFVDVTVDDPRVLQGFDYLTLDPDIDATWRRWIQSGLMVDFGPYYTYAEMTQILDELHDQYPTLTSPKISLGQSWEGRDIWAMRVSAVPEGEDAPTVLINGVHHAREPIGCYITVEFARYLLDRYGTDPEITWLLDHRILWIVPVVNPDGYTYNETPQSGGWWRKNKRDNNNNGTFEEDYDGVDPNRNYAYQWGYDDSGSSPDPGSQIYRGPAPFSEPENQALRALIDSVQPVIVLNYHSYSNLLLYPWGYDQYYTPDQDIFVAMAQYMTAASGYEPATPWEVLYTANGVAIDWMYGEQTEKPKIFAFTPEVGEAFWQPDEATIQEQFNENLPMNLYVLKAAGPYADLEATNITDQTGDAQIDPGDTARIVVTLKNLSPAGPLADLQGVLTTSLGSNYVEILQDSAAFGTLDPLPSAGSDNGSQPYLVAVSPDFPSGAAVPLTLRLFNNEGFVREVPLGLVVGEPVVVFQDSFNTLDHWQVQGSGSTSWGLTNSQYHSAPTSAADSPYGNYANDVNTALVLAQPLDLSQAVAAYVTFWHRYEIETGYDYGYVQVSTDSGNTWITLKSYTGNQSTWQAETLDISGYVGGPVLLRFLFTSDYSVTYDGWYVDDVAVLANLSPEAVTEQEGTDLQAGRPWLRAAVDRLWFQSPAAGPVRLDLYDASGRRILTLFQATVQAGRRIQVSLPASLRSGTYLARLQTPAGTRTLRFVHVR